MKFYLRVFLVSFICFAMMIGGGIFAYVNVTNAKDQGPKAMPELTGDGKEGYVPPVEPVLTELEKLVETSERFNVLVLGTDGARADMILFASYNPEKQLVDMISIPRDTYNEVPGHDKLGQKKINAVYGFKDEELGGSEGMRKSVEKLLGVPIDGYVKVNYNGVGAITNVIGGVGVNVPFDLVYDDPYAEPELHINIPAGYHNLQGEQAVHYLRWRKNNGEEGQGDLPRTDRQQEFIKKAIKKSISLKLPVVAKTAFEYVKTDLTLDKIGYYAYKGASFDMEKLKTHRLPGKTVMNGLSYYIHDAAETEQMLIDIYKSDQGEIVTN